MGNTLNPFEKEIKKAALEYEVPYSPEAWNQLEKKLDSSNGGYSTFSKFIVAAVMISALSIGIFLVSTKEESPIVSNDIATENTNALNTPSTTMEKAISESTEKNLESTDQVLTPTEVTEQRVEISNVTEKRLISSETIVEIAPEMETPNEVAPEPGISEKTEVNELSPVPLRKLTISASSSEVCSGSSVKFTADFDRENTLVWIVKGREVSNDNVLDYVFTDQPGMYPIQAMYKENGLKSNVIEIEVKSNPESNFSLKKELEKGAIPVIHAVPFNSSNSKSLAFQWEINSKIVSYSPELIQTIPDKGEYFIKLGVSHKNGCSSSTTQTFINETDFNLLAPNSFSPNGDGINDTWMPKALTTGYYEFELQVFDRSNRVVYSSNNPQSSWNGIIEGSMPNAGDYFLWKASVTDPNGQSELYGGSIVIIF